MQWSWDLNPVFWLKTPCSYPVHCFQAAIQNHSAWGQADFTMGQTQGFLNLFICIIWVYSGKKAQMGQMWKYCPRFPLNSVFWALTHSWLLWQSPALLGNPQGTDGVYTREHSCRPTLTPRVFLVLTGLSSYYSTTKCLLWSAHLRSTVFPHGHHSTCNAVPLSSLWDQTPNKATAGGEDSQPITGEKAWQHGAAGHFGCSVGRQKERNAGAQLFSFVVSPVP